MAVNRPTDADLIRIATRHRFTIPPGQLEEYSQQIDSFLAAYDTLDLIADATTAPAWPRDTGQPATAAENPLGAWAWRADIRGALDGPLAGRTLAVKDNIAVAGLPMRNGSQLLLDYRPAEDASVVTRVLAAGGRIVGKAVCENLCFSGGSHTATSGPVLNPHDPSRTSGGSSSGAAALVASGAVDMAIGGDQCGSIRIPASWCGVYGLKPTWGLIPYTGAFPMETTLDHLGPIARTTRDVATLLSVLAGADGLDARQTAGVTAPDYSAALTGDIAGMRVGIVREGFGIRGLSQPDVDEAVREAAGWLADLGVSVHEVSLPLHAQAEALWGAIAMEGATALMVNGYGVGISGRGHYSIDLLETFAAACSQSRDELPLTLKLTALAGQWMTDTYHGRYYAKAQNLARALTAAYDALLDSYDLLVLPTLPTKAPALPAPDASLAELVDRALDMGPNTRPFNVTGHPALNVPCAMSHGLAVGMTLVGRHFAEATILRAAHAFEQHIYAPPPPRAFSST